MLSLLGGKFISIAINPVFAGSYAEAKLGHRPALLVAESCDERMRKTVKNKRQAGFSTLEMLIVVAMSITITAIAVPQYVRTTAYLRVAGDLRSLNGLTALAKMRAAAGFTHARTYVDLTANAYHLEVWNKAGNAGAGCWQTDGDTANACSVVGTSPVFNLSRGDTFGAGGLTTGPTPAQQPTIPAQAACQAINGGAGTIASTQCIVFNSRGIPIDSTGSPVATGAFYLNNGTVVDAVTVSATGSIQSWTSPIGSVSWWGQ
jgi:type II secretory pathway pseudopilin PulG